MMQCTKLTDLPAPESGKVGWPWTVESDAAVWLAKRSDWPRVSIVMPSYNQAEFIEESIRSVLLQGYPNLEFFVYDACSSDGSAEIIRKYEPWLTYWVSEKDRGQSDAINKGLRKATGVYFNWQNSDDVLTPNSIFMAVDALIEHPEASYVHGYTELIYEDGSTHSTSENAYGAPSRLAPEVRSALSRLKAGTQPGGLMDRELIVSIGGIDESMRFVMDMDILLRLSVLRPGLYLHEKLVRYRLHPNTMTNSVWPRARRYEKLRIVENVFGMPQAGKYAAYRKEAMATGHRYAAECALMGHDIAGCLYHLMLDVAWSPLKGWSKRRAMFYFIRERKKNDRVMSGMHKESKSDLQLH